MRLKYRGTGHAQARTQTRTRRRPGKFAARFLAALDGFVQYATSQCPRGGPAYVDTADPERHGREVALCSRDMPPHPFTPSNKNRRQLFRPALSTLFDLIM